MTHPEKMDGESVLKQHDNLHKQIAAFEKLLQHAMNKFSREKLYGMLKIVTKDFNREYTPGEHIKSMNHLKLIIDQMENGSFVADSKQLSKETEKHVIKYFKVFFEDVNYLKELKKYFDEKIYICLYEYFYDPLDDVQESELEALLEKYESEDSSDENKEMDGKSLSDDDAKNNQKKQVSFQEQVTEVYVGDRKEEEITFDFLSTKGKLSLAVRQMFKVNNKWDNVLNDSDPHMECYDPDSKYELLVFNDYVKYEAVLRLVPDMFVKAYKSIELAKLWWTQANKVYVHNLPRKRRMTVKELGKQEGELSTAIERVTEDIQRIQETVIKREQDLEALTKRENRYQILNEQCDKLEERKDDVTQIYTTIMNEMHIMKQELAALQKGTKKYTELEERLKEKDKKLMLTEDELKVLAYHFHIMQEDFNLELEIRPHLIRFKADIEEKITGLKNDIENKVNEKRKTEKIMVLLKTNCDRMKHIMQKLNLIEDEESFVESVDKNNDKLAIVDSVANTRKEKPTSATSNISTGSSTKPTKTSNKSKLPVKAESKKQGDKLSSSKQNQKGSVEQNKSAQNGGNDSSGLKNKQNGKGPSSHQLPKSGAKEAKSKTVKSKPTNHLK